MDQHFFGGPFERCTSRNIRTFARGFEAPVWGPGVAEVWYEVPARSPVVIDGASGVPAWGSGSEMVEGGSGNPLGRLGVSKRLRVGVVRRLEILMPKG